jgi:hypothetical protein
MRLVCTCPRNTPPSPTLECRPLLCSASAVDHEPTAADMASSERWTGRSPGVSCPERLVKVLAKPGTYGMVTRVALAMLKGMKDAHLHTESQERDIARGQGIGP